MLYPELPFHRAASQAVPRLRARLVTPAGRRFLPAHACVAWYEPGSVTLTTLPELGGDWTFVSQHPSEERVLISVGTPPRNLLHEIELESRRVWRLPFPPEATAQYVGPHGLVALVEDDLTLLDHHVGAIPRFVAVVRGTYPGRLVAAAGDLVVLAGADAPWAFFRCGGNRLAPVGEIGRDALMISECFVRSGEVQLVGRGAGDDVGVFTPVLEPAPEAPPEAVATLGYASAWDDIIWLPSEVARWKGTRYYHVVVANALAGAGLCLIGPATPASPPTTLLLLFRDRFRNVSLAAVPDAQIDARTRAALQALDVTEGGDIERVMAVVEPFWSFVAGVVRQDAGDDAAPVRIAGRITHVVRARTA